jgi:thiosulfate/3-mercaptopyruvate sulfurtransferase
VSLTPTISAVELSTLIDAPNLRLFDCRFSLKDTDLGATQYSRSHLPNAQYMHLDHDLSIHATAGAGRHPLPSIDEARRMFESKGVSSDSIVVAYDANYNAFAGRLWWLARYAGISNVRILDGGLQAWAELEMPMSNEVPVFEKGRIQGSSTMNVASVVEIEEIANGKSSSMLIDARDYIRYAGHKEPLDKRAGHVPNALNAPFTENMDEEGKFLPKGVLRKRFSDLIGNEATGDNIIHMCGSGVTACNNIIAMELAGYTGSVLYPGSWSGWIEDPQHAAATEAES